MVLVVAGLVIQGAEPYPDDPQEEVRAYFVDNRTSVLTAAYLGSLAGDLPRGCRGRHYPQRGGTPLAGRLSYRRC